MTFVLPQTCHCASSTLFLVRGRPVVNLCCAPTVCFLTAKVWGSFCPTIRLHLRFAFHVAWARRAHKIVSMYTVAKVTLCRPKNNPPINSTFPPIHFKHFNVGYVCIFHANHSIQFFSLSLSLSRFLLLCFENGYEIEKVLFLS